MRFFCASCLIWQAVQQGPTSQPTAAEAATSAAEQAQASIADAQRQASATAAVAMLEQLQQLPGRPYQPFSGSRGDSFRNNKLWAATVLTSAAGATPAASWQKY